jgi:hypothetical protein
MLVRLRKWLSLLGFRCGSPSHDLADLCGDSIDSVLQKYKDYLLVKAPEQLRALERTEKVSREGAMFEAAMFAVMRECYGFDVTIEESGAKGGADFVCRSDSGQFVLEATTLETQSVEDVSGLPHHFTPGETRFFASLTHKLRKTAGDKTPQLSGYPVARLMAVGSFHSASEVLFSNLQVEWLLMSQPKIVVRPYDSGAPPHQETDLANSVFFRSDAATQTVVPCRQSISAILLVSMGARECLLRGVLHPEPRQVFDYRLLPDIPFLRVANWPLSWGSQIQTEWVIADPDPRRKWLREVRFKNSELRAQ